MTFGVEPRAMPRLAATVGGRFCGSVSCLLVVLAVSLALHVRDATAAESIPAGKSDFEFRDERGNVDRPIRVWSYRPKSFTNESPIVFVMHGTLRNGEEYREPWIPLADRYEALVVVPEFSVEHYRGQSTYQFGNVKTPEGEPNDESKWTFTAIEHLFDHVKAATENRSERYFIFGHSAGSQFVHRMVLLKSDTRIALAVAANAGSYTMPDDGVDFPYGLGKSPSTDARLKAALGMPMLVLLGEEDNDPNDRYLPKNAYAMAQGAHRLERGKNFFRAAQLQARRLDVPLRWTMQTVADVGHDNAKMAPLAARAMFEAGRDGE